MSLAYERLFFLWELGQLTRRQEREQMIDWMNSAIMEAFAISSDLEIDDFNWK